MNKDTRKPTLSELIAAAEREKALRLRDSLKRATAKAEAEYTTKRKAWLTFYGFPIDPTNDDGATPSPDDDDDLPDDWGYESEGKNG